jgi:hypothetical protein
MRKKSIRAGGQRIREAGNWHVLIHQNKLFHVKSITLAPRTLSINAGDFNEAWDGVAWTWPRFLTSEAWLPAWF